MPDLVVNMTLAPIVLAAAGSASGTMIAGLCVNALRSRRQVWRWRGGYARALRAAIARIIAPDAYLARFD
jgi:hypothetical protein